MQQHSITYQQQYPMNEEGAKLQLFWNVAEGEERHDRRSIRLGVKSPDLVSPYNSLCALGHIHPFCSVSQFLLDKHNFEIGD